MANSHNSRTSAAIFLRLGAVAVYRTFVLLLSGSASNSCLERETSFFLFSSNGKNAASNGIVGNERGNAMFFSLITSAFGFILLI